MGDESQPSPALAEADECFKQNKFQEALEKYSTLITNNADDAELLLRRSRCHYCLKDYDKAFADAKAAYDLDPTNIQTCVCCGRAATKEKAFERAFRYYKSGLQIDPKSQVIADDLRKLQGIILEESDKNIGVEPTYSAVRFCTQDAYPGDNEMYKLEQEILEKKYHISGNQQTTTPGADVKPEEAAKHAAMAIQFRAGGNMSAALEHCHKAVAIYPSNILYRQLRAEVHIDSGQLEEALRDLCAIPKQSRSGEVWKLGGKLLYQLELPVSSEFWLRRVTKISDNKDEESAILFQKVRTDRLYRPLTEDFPVKVDFGQFGRSIVATEDIPAGTECLTDRPVILCESLSNKIPGCGHCAMSMLTPKDYFGEAMNFFDDVVQGLVDEFWPDVTPIMCEDCNRVHYCSKSCREEAWTTYHKVICPAHNPAAGRIYDLAENGGWETNKDGEREEIWFSAYSPLVLARIWATIVMEVQSLVRAAGVAQPIVEHWAKAKAPFRRFIAFGSSRATDRMPLMTSIFREVFQNCGDGVSYDINENEFNGRYFQATCNLQLFTSYVTPYQLFLTNLSEKADQRGIRILKYLKKSPPQSAFTGMFALHACLNHSCYNNVEVRDGRCSDGSPGVAVIAKRDIKKGEELYTTYIDTSMPRRLRRAWLYKSFNFWCQCLRCKYEGEEATTCTTCSAKADEGKKFPSCGKCYKAWYCSVNCQKKAWKQGHKTICQTEHSEVHKLKYDLL